MDPSSGVQDILANLGDIQVAELASAAATTIYLYDILLTFALEVSRPVCGSTTRIYNSIQRCSISGHALFSIYRLYSTFSIAMCALAASS